MDEITPNPAPEPTDPPEVDPGELVREELDRLVHHPRQEESRLRGLADDGESGATPFFTIGRLAMLLWPLALLLIGVVLAVYFYA